jgi:hypothetical protein
MEGRVEISVAKGKGGERPQPGSQQSAPYGDQFDHFCNIQKATQTCINLSLLMSCIYIYGRYFLLVILLLEPYILLI